MLIELIHSYREREKACKHVMKKQTMITFNMRKELINWLFEFLDVFVLEKMEMNSILYQAVMILDRYCEKVVIQRKEYQIIGAICLGLAMKYESSFSLTFDDILYYCDTKDYTKNDLSEYEMRILKALDFNISFVNSYMVMTSLILCDGDVKEEKMKYAMDMLKTCLLDERLMTHKPSLVASTVVYLSNIHFGEKKVWGKTLKDLTRYRANRFDTVKSILVIES